MWQETNNALFQKFSFKNFDEAIDFINKVARIAEEVNHHPTISNTYNEVQLTLTTHSAGNIVTEKDREFASRVDKLLSGVEEDRPSTLTRAKLYTDGGSRGNPGPSALGYAILNMDDNVVKKDSQFLGVTTNNQAEYLGLKSGLEAAIKMGIKEVDVYMDSMLVVNQMNGSYKVKNPELLPVHQKVKELAQGFKNINFYHVPRELNSIADRMVNECLDSST